MDGAHAETLIIDIELALERSGTRNRQGLVFTSFPGILSARTQVRSEFSCRCPHVVG